MYDYTSTLYMTTYIIHYTVTKIAARWRCYIQQKKFRLLKEAGKKKEWRKML